MNAPLIISGCTLAVFGILLLSDTTERKKKVALQRWANLCNRSGSLKTSRSDNAFADSMVLTGWRNQLLVLRERISAVGGIVAFIPVLVISVVLTGAVYYFTNTYGPEIAISAASAMCLVCLIGGYRFLQNKLRKRFNESLPIAIDLVVRAVSAGVALPASFDHVAESLPGSVGMEFQRMHDSIRIGKPVREALEQAVRRIPSAEFHFFAIILSLNLETGGRLSESLGNLSTKLRERRQMERKVKAMTAEPRTSAIIVAFFPPIFLGLLYLMSPNQFTFLFTDSVGKSLLGYATVSTVLGILQLYRMTRIN